MTMPPRNVAVSAAKAAANREPDAKRDRPPGVTPVRQRSASAILTQASSRNSPPLDTARSQPESPPRLIDSGSQSRNSRARKDSLRKSALMTTSKMKLADGVTVDEVKVLQNPIVESHANVRLLSPAPISPETARFPTLDAPPHSPSLDISTPRPSSIPPPVPMVTHPVHGDPSKILEVTDAKEPFPDFTKTFPPTISSTASTVTTTDDDDNSSITSPIEFLTKKTSALSLPSKSYFPSQPLRPPRLTQQTVPKNKSPLAALPPSLPSAVPNEWDYSETRWWGWIILCVTWIFFVVGMGSCFGVWSWAWDVGETPYAPPEFEDDPTLPIVGYYPALIVLTCVMAWVWVTIAWVGMKYFKHANISGEDE